MKLYNFNEQYFKRKKKTIISLLITIIILAIVITIWLLRPNANNNNQDYFAFNKEQISMQSHQSELFQKYFNAKDITAEKNHFEQELGNYKLINDAEKSEITSFSTYWNNNYNWTDFSDLNQDLLHHKISSKITSNINWEKFIINNKNLDNNKKDLVKEKLCHFYNVMAQLYHKSNIEKLLQSIQIMNSNSGNDNILAETIAAVNGAKQYQVYQNEKLFDEKLYNDNFNSGFWTTNDIIGTIVHEYGHAISNFCRFPQSVRDKINQQDIKLIGCGVNNHQIINHENLPIVENNYFKGLFNDPTSVLMNFLDHEAQINPNNHDESLIFPLLVVNYPLFYAENGQEYHVNTYSQSAWNNNNYQQRDEFFAEAFARWMLPVNNNNSKPSLTSPQNRAWALLNKFFTQYLTIYYQI